MKDTSIELLDHDITAVSIFLSGERLARFQAITGSQKAAILLHQQMLQLGITLMAVTAVIEIATRNAICERVDHQFGVSGWLRTPPNSFTWEQSEREKIKQAEASARKALYAKKNQTEKKAMDLLAYPNGVPEHLNREEISKACQKQIIVNDGQIIAQLTMFFWKRLFSTDYEMTLWNRSLKHIFPDKKIKRAIIATHFEEIYQARNRIAHHEPIYDKRLDKVLSAIDFIVKNFGTKDSTGKTPLGKLLDAEIQTLITEAEDLKEKIASFRQSATGSLQVNVP